MELLTLIIPTRNRPRFLERALEYYGRQRLRCPVLVVDSSDERLERAAASAPSMGNGVEVRWREAPPRTSLTDKLAQVAGMIETPYVVIGSDDDFFVPQALAQAVTFLEAHQDYSAAHGTAALFALRSGTVHGPIAWVSEYRQRTLQASRPSRRLLAHLRSYMTTWYSVQRTADWREHVRSAARLELDAYFSEVLQSGLSVVCGRIKKLKGLYMARQAHGDQETNRSPQDFFEWFAGPRWAEQCRRVRDRLALSLTQHEGLTSTEAQHVAEQALWRYQMMRGAQAEREAARRVSDTMADARLVWRRLRWAVARASSSLSLKMMTRRGSTYYDAFRPIYQTMTEGPSASEAMPVGAESRC